MPTEEGNDLVIGESKIARPLVKPEWVTGKDGKRYLLTHDHLELGQTEAYSPMRDEPALNEALACLELSEDGIAEFVVLFGWLGVDQRFKTADDEWAWGEPLDRWRHEVAAFRALRKIVHGKAEPDYTRDESYTDAEGRAWRRLVFHGPNVSSEICVPAYPDNARVLSEARSRIIEVELTEQLCDGVGAFVADGVISFRPKTVLGTAYLQIAQDYEGKEESRYGRCQTCGRYFKASARNPDQKGCGSEACRQARYAANRATAYRLKVDEGLTVQQIAKRMRDDLGEGVTVDQVKRWIASAQKRKGRDRP